jgi:hypothetical protein
MSAKGPKSIPTQLQLPGGVVLKAMPFRVVEFNADGTPKLFELQPDGAFDIKNAATGDGTVVLFARETLLRQSWRGKATPPDSDR